MKTLGLIFASLFLSAAETEATPFTTTVPGTGVALPSVYPEAGGVAIVLTGANGNIYYQFSDPDGAFRGFQFRGAPAAFRGNPFTINNPIPLDCGFRSCSEYFGGSIARVDIRFSAFDGDTQVGGFDYQDIDLLINGFNVGSWSDRNTERTNTTGTTSLGFENGFGNNTFNTGWFSSTNSALLANILATGQTVTQVFDDDPDDNFWDFRRGPSLPDEELRTIAPGYEFDKSIVGGATTFSTVGEVLTYEYRVRNIGSVDINDITVTDDRIPSVTCPEPNDLESTESGGTLTELVCTGTYTVTQADIDAGTLTNIARANGTPEFGQLGEVVDEVTLTGPTQTNALDVRKTADRAAFSAVGEVITYSFEVENTGNTTLTSVDVTDPRIPALSCAFPSILPGVTETCSGTYTVTQADFDAFATSGTTLDNTATATASAPGGATVSDTATESVGGAASGPALTIVKTADQADFDAVGDTLTFTITVSNTGNVTWPDPPTVTDPTAEPVVCPAGAVPPGAAVVCTASYEVRQVDLDAGGVTNTAEASVTVGGATATGSDSVTVPAVTTGDLTILKRLQAGSPDPVSAITDELIYEYVLTNTGSVTLSAPAVTDNLVAVTCPPGDIAPGASVTCTSDVYAVSQVDLDAGGVTNTADATAELPGGGTVGPVQTSLTVAADPVSELTMTKTAPTVDPIDFVPGNTVTYSYVVENSGATTISDPILVTDDRIATPFACGTVPLAPGASVTCSATYTITTADVAAGVVTNLAFASDGTTTSNTDTATVPQAGTPAITLTKTADTADFDEVTDTLTYTFTVANTGEVAISDPITIDDPALDTSTCAAAQPAILFPPGSGSTPTEYTCTVDFAGLTQADLDAGEYVNTASASFSYTDPIGGGTSTISSPSSTATVPADVTEELTVTKTTTDGYGAVGDTLTYTITVENTGTVTLSDVTVTDPLFTPALVCTLGTLAPGATDSTCSGTYAATQADLDAGQIDNTATVTATLPSGGTLTETATETVLLDPGAGTRELSLAKTATPDTFAAVGETISYVLSVTNIGTLTLSDVTVTDAPLGVSCAIPTLAPGVTDVSCVASYTVTQADLDRGFYENTATAAATGATPVDATERADGPARTASFIFDKVADGPFAAVDDTVTFTLSVTNTGNVTLTSLEIADPFFTPALTCTLPDLAPGSTDASCVASYTVTQADVDAGTITNTATLTGEGVDGAPFTDTTSETVSGPTPTGSFAVSKTESDASGGFGLPGSTETYAFSVTNTGNVTLSDITLTDPLTGFSCAIADLSPGDTATTCANGDPLEADYTVSQADFDSGEIENTVDVTGETPGGAPVSASDTLTLSGPDQLPALTLAKAATGGAGFTTVGETLSYDYTVTNSGNVTLTAPITIADDRTSVSCPALPPGGLAPGATLTCTATDAVTQADLDAGSVTNTATANVTQPVVPSPTYPGGSASVSSPPDSETLSAGQAPSLAIEKRIAAPSDVPFDDTSDVVTFEFEVTNTGNVTLTDAITVIDTTIPATVSCGGVGLAPGDSVTCTTTWSPDQAAIDAGSFTNSASASTVFDGTPVTSPTDSVTVPGLQTPELVTAKSFNRFETPGGGAGAFQTGDIVFYDYVVENLGNVTISGPVTVSDNLVPSVFCPAGDLLPGASLTCTGQYTLTATDISLGSVVNLATSTATGPGGPVTSPPTSETVPIDADPALTITKATTATGFSAVGEVIDYTYTVTNTSSGASSPAFANVVNIEDDRIGTFACFTPSAGNPDLTVGETISCSASYTVTQADLDAVQSGSPNGFVTNNAVGRTTFAGTDVVSPPVSVTVNAAGDPALTVAKSVVSGPSPAAEGDTLTYRIITTNSGNVTLSSVDVDDPLIPVLSCVAGGLSVSLPTSLAVGEALICDGDYTVTQADIDAQALTNTATATALSPQGGPVTGSGSNTQPLVTPTPAFTVAKALAPGQPATFQAVGETLEFVVTVENTGNVTLNGVEVTDSLVPGTCSIGTLAPGASDASCVFVYTVTQTDIDAGQVDNIATATGTPATPGGTPTTETGSATTPGPLREPGFTLAKDADLTEFSAPGETITYTYTIANTGNVTLPGPFDLTDDRIATITCAPVPAGGVLPGDDLVCTATDVTTQDDVDAGEVVNVATLETTDPIVGGPLTTTATETVPADQAAGLEATKTVAVPDTAPGTVVTYTLEVANTGNVTLIPTGITDTLTLNDGAAAALDAPFALQSGDTDGDGRISVGETWFYTAPFTITQDAIDAGGFTNVASVETETPGGDPVTDIADDGDDTDGNTTDDPTIVTIAPAPGLDVVKTFTTTGVTAGDTVTFEIQAENTGNVTISDVSLADTLTDATGAPLSPDLTRLVSGLTGTTLAAGDTAIWEVVYTLTQADIDAGGIRNSATVSGTVPGGAPISDISDDGDDTDGNTEDDPTELLIPAVNTITVLKSVTDIARLGPTSVRAEFTIEVENTGNITQQNLVIEDDLTAFAAPATVTSASIDAFTGFDGTGGANPGYDGDTDINLAEADVDLLPGSTGSITFTVVLDTTAGSPASPNTVGVTSDTITTPVTSSVVFAPIGAPSLTVEKTASPTDARVGETISYVITFTNEGSVAESGVTLVDQLPPALRYVTDSALYDGSATPAPDIAGNTLRWTGLTIAPAQTVTVTLDALLIDGPGEFTNTAFLIDSSGGRISTVGRASVFVRPEAVFDCGDVIGKVFDDRNLNGYQDGPEDLAAAERAQISDQTFGSGKAPSAISPEAIDGDGIPEPGLPRVKLATINGTVITTDEYGRFSVPCAELPDGTIGSNFTLKLDERTLPTGYQLTTENPRTIRLTAGTMAKLNFGAALADVVEIDLTNAAFNGESNQPTGALASGIAKLAAQLSDTPSLVKLTYVRGRESREVARSRLDRVEGLLRNAWADQGQYRLVIERTIVRVQ